MGECVEKAAVGVYIRCTHESDGVSTWAKFDGHIYHRYPIITMYYRSAFVVVCLQLETAH